MLNNDEKRIFSENVETSENQNSDYEEKFRGLPKPSPRYGHAACRYEGNTEKI